LAAACALTLPLELAAAELASVPARAAVGTSTSAFDGVVEAVRQTVIAAQVPGAVVQLEVKVGDRVSAGQVLLRLDARAADQSAAASEAQVQAARALLEAAGKDFERQKQLFQKSYISQAALDRAESDLKSTQAQAQAQLAQAGAARTQSGFYVVRAPFSGVVSDVPVALGDMAMPGRPLLTLYDPSALRISASVPQSVASLISLDPKQAAVPAPKGELPGLRAASPWVPLSHVQLLPTVDPSTHTIQIRADLPAGLVGLSPGMFARLWLPLAGSGNGLHAAALSVSAGAIVRRAEMTGLYVLDPKGLPVLRQVRLGPIQGDQVEVLSGLMPGERVVSDPQAAARVR
jgi:RND family efflux transporter MFP subunit